MLMRGFRESERGEGGVYIIRKRIEKKVGRWDIGGGEDLYMVWVCRKKMMYKGMVCWVELGK